MKEDACMGSNSKIKEHFTSTGKVLIVGNNAKMNISDYKLSRKD